MSLWMAIPLAAATTRLEHTGEPHKRKLSILFFFGGSRGPPFLLELDSNSGVHLGGGGGGHSPPLAGCLPPLEILLYIYCIVQHVALAPPPWYAKTAS